MNDNNESYEVGERGVYDITVSNPQNYEIEYSDIGMLYVNPTGNNLQKIRTSLDCIEISTNQLGYVANFSYYNPNSETIYVLHGTDNNFIGSAVYEGESPIVFLPGEGIFSISFDGQKLIWNLTTFESTHKSSVSSEATLDSGKCDAKNIDSSNENQAYKLYPSPFENTFTVERNIIENGKIDMYNLYGVLCKSIDFNKINVELIEIDMTGYPNGIYYARITSGNDLYTYSIIKQ